jgi:hypothetical protein
MPSCVDQRPLSRPWSVRWQSFSEIEPKNAATTMAMKRICKMLFAQLFSLLQYPHHLFSKAYHFIVIANRQDTTVIAIPSLIAAYICLYFTIKKHYTEAATLREVKTTSTR